MKNQQISNRQFKSEDGQGLVEYALILVVIAVAVILLLSALSNGIGGSLARMNAIMSGQEIADSGTTVVILDLQATVTPQGGGECRVEITEVTVAMFVDGTLATEGTGTADLVLDGEDISESFTLSGNTISVPMSGDESGPCPMFATNSAGYSRGFE